MNRLPWTWTRSELEHVASSLTWEGDDLVDWVGGGARLRPDGGHVGAGVFYPYDFDRAVATPDGRWSALYTWRGTKAILLRDGRLHREVDRSYYHAHVTEYPLAFVPSADGWLLAHCPDEYNQLELEDVATGARRTARTGEDCDFFHSRLQVSPGGRWLISAGWVWHPFEYLQVFAVADALADPAALGRWHAQTELGALYDPLVEASSAAFVDDARLLVTVGGFEAHRAVLYDLDAARILRTTALPRPAGALLPLGPDHALALYEHPRLYDLRDGSLVHAWPDLATGAQTSSICHHIDPPPPLALDLAGRRVAIGRPGGVTVLRFSPA